MKKVICAIALMLVTLLSYAQEVQTIYVGPYEVTLKDGDISYRLSDEKTPYEYLSRPVKSTWQFGGYVLPRYAATETSAIIGGEAVRKFVLLKNMSLNVGGSLDVLLATYSGSGKQAMVDVGIPVTVEWARLDRYKSSFFGAVGLQPTLYADFLDSVVAKKPVGFYLAPRVEFGVVFPVGGNLFRLGLRGQYNWNLVYKGDNVFPGFRSRIFMGASFSVIL